jgi:hypothetical protein
MITPPLVDVAAALHTLHSATFGKWTVASLTGNSSFADAESAFALSFMCETLALRTCCKPHDGLGAIEAWCRQIAKDVGMLCSEDVVDATSAIRIMCETLAARACMKMHDPGEAIAAWCLQIAKDVGGVMALGRSRRTTKMSPGHTGVIRLEDVVDAATAMQIMCETLAAKACWMRHDEGATIAAWSRQLALDDTGAEALESNIAATTTTKAASVEPASAVGLMAKSPAENKCKEARDPIDEYRAVHAEETERARIAAAEQAERQRAEAPRRRAEAATSAAAAMSVLCEQVAARECRLPHDLSSALEAVCRQVAKDAPADIAIWKAEQEAIAEVARKRAEYLAGIEAAKQRAAAVADASSAIEVVCDGLAAKECKQPHDIAGALKAFCRQIAADAPADIARWKAEQEAIAVEAARRRAEAATSAAAAMSVLCEQVAARECRLPHDLSSALEAVCRQVAKDAPADIAIWKAEQEAIAEVARKRAEYLAGIDAAKHCARSVMDSTAAISVLVATLAAKECSLPYDLATAFDALCQQVGVDVGMLSLQHVVDKSTAIRIMCETLAANASLQPCDPFAAIVAWSRQVAIDVGMLRLQDVNSASTAMKIMCDTIAAKECQWPCLDEAAISAWCRQVAKDVGLISPEDVVDTPTAIRVMCESLAERACSRPCDPQNAIAAWCRQLATDGKIAQSTSGLTSQQASVQPVLSSADLKGASASTPIAASKKDDMVSLFGVKVDSQGRVIEDSRPAPPSGAASAKAFAKPSSSPPRAAVSAAKKQADERKKAADALEAAKPERKPGIPPIPVPPKKPKPKPTEPSALAEPGPGVDNAPLSAVLSVEQKRETSEFRKRRGLKGNPQSPPRGLEPDGSPSLGSPLKDLLTGPVIFAPKPFQRAQEYELRREAEAAARRLKHADEMQQKLDKRKRAMELVSSKGFSSDLNFFGMATARMSPQRLVETSQLDPSFAEHSSARSHAHAVDVSKEALATEGTARFITGKLSKRVADGTVAARASLQSAAGARPCGHRSDQVGSTQGACAWFV